jgi:fatty acid-binding protein DegV
VIELAGRASSGRPVERMAIVHINALAEARQLEKQLRARLTCPENIIVAELTPGLSIYDGVGMVGVVFVAGK